jgi:NAD(P)-dependent dehydrogenase (short-subunit alcohol dehydrogenase family)
MAAEQGVAIVTGGGSGIGLAIAEQLARDGWRLLIADLSDTALEAARGALAASGDRARFVTMDVASESSVADVLRAGTDGFGPVRGLVNSAGIGRDVPFLETSAALFRQVLDVNLVGNFIVARETARLMAGHGGAMVNIASVAGLRGSVGRSAYGASKAGVINLTQVMAVELASHRIRVNAIAPGPIETPLVAAMHPPAVRAGWIERVPQRRYAAPSEVAGAAAFLLDETRASFITGHVLTVDGGFAAGGLLPPSN